MVRNVARSNAAQVFLAVALSHEFSKGGLLLHYNLDYDHINTKFGSLSLFTTYENQHIEWDSSIRLEIYIIDLVWM